MHKQRLSLVFAIACLLATTSSARCDDTSSEALDPNDAARIAFQNDRFGLFVHWGVYSLLGKGEWVMERDKLPISEYEKLPSRFNPTEFDAEGWVKLARAAGMKYLTITAKHHDGFCMFDSKLTGYDIVDATPYAKDPLKALADACHKNGVKLYFYYSLLDWHHPDYFPLGRTGHHAGRELKGDWSKYVAYYQGQIRELCTNYGPIGGVWFDGWWDAPTAAWDLEGTYKLIHELQPGALVGNNHHVAPKPGEDFQMFERDLPGANTAGFNKAGVASGLPLESCDTINESWGYNATDTRFKSAEELIRRLVGAAGRGSNLLLNVGPRPDGTLSAEFVDRLKAVGQWLETHGDTIYGTRRGPIPPQPWGVSTRKVDEPAKGAIYLHVLDRSVPLRVPQASLSFAARILGETSTLMMEQQGKDVVIDLPPNAPEEVDTVIVLTPGIEDRVLRSRR